MSLRRKSVVCVVHDMRSGRAPVQQVRGRALARDEGAVLVQHVRLEVVHVVRVVRREVLLGDGVIVPPVEVVRLASLALKNEGMLANVLVKRGCAAFLQLVFNDAH